LGNQFFKEVKGGCGETTHPNTKHFDGKEEVRGRPKTTIATETLR